MLAEALVVPDSGAFLDASIHELDEIYEVPRPPAKQTTELPHPAGVN